MNVEKERKCREESKGDISIEKEGTDQKQSWEKLVMGFG